MKWHLITYIPGHAQRTIDRAHGMIIDLRKEKTGLLEDTFYVNSLLGPTKDDRMLIIDEKIKQWEEVIKLWNGKLDPSRNKIFWSIFVPVFISIVVPVLLYYFLGGKFSQ